MRGTIATLAAAACASTALPAVAQDRKAYAGFGAGLFHYEDDRFGDAVLADDTTAFRLLGGYRFSERFAVEGAWGATSNLEESIAGVFDIIPILDLSVDLWVDYEVLTVRAVGILPFEKVNLLGGVGYYDARIQTTFDAEDFDLADVRTDESGATLLGGLQFDLERRVSLRGELEWLDVDSDVEAWTFTFGALFRF